MGEYGNFVSVFLSVQGGVQLLIWSSDLIASTRASHDHVYVQHFETRSNNEQVRYVSRGQGFTYKKEYTTRFWKE